MQNKIYWTKTPDVFALPGKSETDWYPRPIEDDKYNNFDDYEDNFDQMMDDEENEPPQKFRLPNGMNGIIDKVRFLQTPAGIYPLNDKGIPSRVFNLWTFHTNFPITQEIAHRISEVNGVEGYRTQSRYRGEIAVGLAFRPRDVCSQISRMFCGPETEELTLTAKMMNDELTPEIEEKINSIISVIPKSNHWICYIFPNGRHTLIVEDGKSIDKFKESLQDYCTLQVLVGGHIRTSFD